MIGIIIITILISGCTGKVPEELSEEKLGNEVLNIGEGIPNGWSYTVIAEEGKMGSPHGLEEPVIRVDFINQNEELENFGTTKKYNPSLRLYFYNIAEKQEIIEIITGESVYSWCIPIYFDETNKYIIVTSPCYKTAEFSRKKRTIIIPLWKSR